MVITVTFVSITLARLLLSKCSITDEVSNWLVVLVCVYVSVNHHVL